jgi:hypothetical protein
MERPTPDSAREQAKAKDAFDRITFLGWRKGLAAIVLGLAASFFLFGYALVYWRNADMDFMVVYNALVLNDGKPQQFFDHTAYLTILSVQFWFKLLHGLGLLDAWTLSSIPPASNAAPFDAAMTSAVRAARLLAWLTATGCVLVFAGLMRLVVRDWRVALIATFAFAFSGGVAVHSRILRSELVAACPVFFALLILIAIGRRGSVARPLAMALAAAHHRAIRQRRRRQRRILVQSGIGMACDRHRRPRRLRGDVGGIAADRRRLRSRVARRGAIPSVISGKIRRIPGRAADPDRRLHGGLRSDLARHRGRNSRLDVYYSGGRHDRVAGVEP